MKYLTKYKLFENSNHDDIKSNIVEIAQTVKEILLPISDMGYEISVLLKKEMVVDDVLKGKLTGLIIRVVDYNDTPLKFNDEVKEEFIRMSDYLEYEGFNSIKAIYVGSQMWPNSGKTFGNKSKCRVDFSKFISINSGNIMSLVFVVEVD